MHGIFPKGQKSSPRTWRCFSWLVCNSDRWKVFSTYVEVFPRSSSSITNRRCLLHVRGGVSPLLQGDFILDRSSPRTWRCFYPLKLTTFPRSVFSTYVEVFPHVHNDDPGRCGLLHVRGGVSMASAGPWPRSRSSPRTWRCFSTPFRQNPPVSVFSTYVEVFLLRLAGAVVRLGLLHARGGVSF